MKTPTTAKTIALTLTATAAAIAAALLIGGCGVTDNGDDAGKRFALFNGKSARTLKVPTYTLTTDITPAGSGTTERSPNQTSYNAGTTVTACAAPAGGHEFTGWTGAATSAETCVAIIMDDNKTLIANFKETRIITPTMYTLTVYAANGGAVSLPENSAYEVGATVTVTAIPDEGYAFVGWTGALTSGEHEVTVSMDGNKALFASFRQKTYALSTSVTPEGCGAVSQDPDRTDYTHGTQVTVTAITFEGCAFIEWSGDLTSTETSEVITMDDNKTLTANFRQDEPPPPTYTLEVSANPAEGGTASRNPSQSNYIVGTEVTVTATPRENYKFTGWTDAPSYVDASEASITVTMNNDMTLTANFQQITYTLTVNADPAEGGTVSPAGATTHNAGAYVTVMTTPEEGYAFTGWSGTVNSPDPTILIQMNRDTELTANFLLIPPNHYTLGIEVNPIIGGTVSREPDQADYIAGTLVTVTASPNEGYVFTGWSGDLAYTEVSMAIIMDGNKTLTANFLLASTLIDSRDGQKYHTVEIGGKRWMAENLNYTTANGWCYDDDPENCAKYGKLYVWDAAMSACPAGWRLPTRADWDDLVQAAGGKLKSKTGWNDYGNGTDDFGFSALPGGFRSNNSFYNVGRYGYWWSATEINASYAYYRYMGISFENVNEDNDLKSYGCSVRCLRN